MGRRLPLFKQHLAWQLRFRGQDRGRALVVVMPIIACCAAENAIRWGKNPEAPTVSGMI